MDLENFKKEYVQQELGISDIFGKIITFIDFGNVNYWFEDDNQDWNNTLIAEDEKISIDLGKLKSFADIFSSRVKIYYEENPKNQGSLNFTYVLRKI